MRLKVHLLSKLICKNVGLTLHGFEFFPACIYGASQKLRAIIRSFEPRCCCKFVIRTRNGTIFLTSKYPVAG